MVRAAFFVCVTLMLSGIAAITFWTGPMIMADGVAIFDTRSGGYDLSEAREILAAMSAQARAAYLGPERIADTVFPVGLLGTLGIGIFYGARRLSLGVAVLLTLVPVAYFAFDMLENAGVARLLVAPVAGLTPEDVATVSGYTVWKFRFVNLSLGLLVLIWSTRAGAAFVAWKRTQT